MITAKDVPDPVLREKLTPAGYVFRGSGTPEAVVTAPIGSLFLRTDGSTNTTLYVKESGTGNTGWAAK